MAETSARKKAVDFLFVLNAAITNIRLYPPTSAIILSSVERMSKAVMEALELVGSLEYAESEKNLLVQSVPLPEKEQQKPQVASFIGLMLDMGIRSLTFTRGIDHREITGFLQVLAKSPEEIETGGGLQKVLEQYHITHIEIDEKIYIGFDSEHSILAGMDITDEAFARFLLGDQEISAEDKEKIREIATDPEWFSTVFEFGIKQVLDGPGGRTDKDMSETVAGIIAALEGASDFNKREISEYILNSMAEMDETVLASVLTQNLDVVFGEEVFVQFVAALDPDRFKKLMSRIEELAGQSAAGNLEPDQAEAIGRVYQLLARIDNERNSAAGNASAEALSDETSNPAEQKFAQLKSALNRIAKGDAGAFAEKVITEALPDTFMQLLAGGKDSTAQRLIERMGEALLNEDPEVRKTVAGLMARIDEKLESTEQLEQRIALSKKLSDWVRFETEVTREFETVSVQLEELSRHLLEGGRSEDAAHILEAYHLVSAGNLEKEEAIRALAGNMLQNLATEDILDLLMQEPREKGQKPEKDDIYSLVILGSTTIERLLDRLHDSHSMSERNRIVQAVTQIGKPALQTIIERVKQDGPWYYIRNLVLLLGRLGDDRHLRELVALLKHPDYRVQREAIKSVQAIGGPAAGAVLFESIDKIDDQLKDYLITVIGALQYREAAPVFIEMLSRPGGATKTDRNEIREKLCEALGRMRATEAVSALEKIVRKKGFFGRKNPENVRSAAARALANIKRN